MITELCSEAQTRMRKSVEALQQEMSKLRTGRANPSLLDHLMVVCYGRQTPLNQVGNISVEDARTLAITIWDKANIPAVEKAIVSADLGLNPVTAGEVIRVVLPELTEERRRDFVKMVRVTAEQARVSVRTIRREANTKVKTAVKDKELNEDDEKRAQAEIQKLTDRFVAEVDGCLKVKEEDLMHV